MIDDIIMEEVRFNGRAMRDLLCDIDVYILIPEKEVLAVDPEGRSFVNINTREDLKQATGG